MKHESPLTDGLESFSALLPLFAAKRPDWVVFEFVSSSGEVTPVTFAMLHEQASVFARFLLRSGRAGDRVVLLYPDSRDFISAFFGTLYAGMIAVPCLLPLRAVGEAWSRFEAVIENAQPRFIATNVKGLEVTGGLKSSADRHIVAHFLERDGQQKVMLPSGACFDSAAYADLTVPVDTGPGELALLQYTSGSTSVPKGVEITHGNLIANSRAISACFSVKQEDRGVSWLPFYHDMGLIGGLLQPVFCGSSTRILTPSSFVKKPLLWLQHISEFKATVNGAPNFAYDLCCQRVTEEQIAALDFSHWSTAFCGAEPISVPTLQRFAQHLAPSGFRADAFLPCYGMAETTLLVTGGGFGRGVRTQKFEGRDVVDCGRVFDSTRVKLVDPVSLVPRADGNVGEIWVSGPGVGRGYWENPSATEATFHARLQGDKTPWLRTGDLGYLKGDSLFVTGRIKESIIVNGHNHYPTDIEATIRGADPGLASLTACAFSVVSNERERVVVLVTTPRGEADFPMLARKIRSAVNEGHSLTLSDIVFVSAKTLPLTTSGKLQRVKAAALYQSGKLSAVWQSAACDEPAVSEMGADRNLAEDTAAIAEFLAEEIGRSIKKPVASSQYDDAFSSFELDSLQAVGLIGEAETHLGIELSPTMVYDYPTINKLASALASMVNATLGADDPQPLKTQPGTPADDPSTHGDAPVARVAETKPASAIAIIGMEVRVPGRAGVADFWTSLKEGQSHNVNIDPARWSDDLPFTSSRKPSHAVGSFFGDIRQFDPQFFAMSDVEAATSDPQHRFLLEATEQAFRDAGINPDSLKGRRVGVFIGISAQDFAFVSVRQPNAFSGLGSASSIAANRLSYFYDLRGPSVAVDTACSSSLVALDLAKKSLQDGGCELAVVGGVNLAATGHLHHALVKAGMLAQDGRCKTFDAGADGYGRGEGCVVLVLKPEDAAREDADRIYARIAGCAVNQDGRSNGITAPNGPSQVHVIKDAIRDAGISIDEVDYLEAHGTGTTLGDLIEFESLENVFLSRSGAAPVLVGSVKTNFGHLEAAAGLLGVAKTTLMLYHGQIVPHLNLRTVNPRIDNIRRHVDIAGDRLVSAPLRYAGVSSFGFGGTNAHAILARVDVNPTGEDLLPNDALLLVSSYSEAAARAQLDATKAALENVDDDHMPAWSARLAQTVRSSAWRGFVVGNSKKVLLEGVQRMRMTEAEKTRNLVWMFPGQGARYVGFNETLMESCPLYKDMCHEVSQLVLKNHQIDLLSVEGENRESIGDPSSEDVPPLSLHEQFLNFASSYALAMTLVQLGVRPSAVIGHSFGEYCAAVIAGHISLDMALDMIAARCRCLAPIPEKGAMAALFVTEEEARRLIAPFGEDLSLATQNGPRAMTIAGKRSALKACLAEASSLGYRHLPVRSPFAFHSALVEPAIGPYQEWLQHHYQGKASDIPLYVADDAAPRRQLGAGRWVHHLRSQVRFADTVQQCARDMDPIFVDLSGDGVLTYFVSSCDRQYRVCTVGRKKNGDSGFLGCLGALWSAGHSVDFSRLFPHAPRGSDQMPRMQFMTKAYWPDSTPVAEGARPSPPARPVAIPPVTTGSKDLAMTDRSTQIAQLRRDLTVIAARHLGLTPEEIDGDLPLQEIGADSLALLNVISEVEDQYGVSLPVQDLVGDLRTLNAVADYVGVHAAASQPSADQEKQGPDAAISMIADVSAPPESTPSASLPRLPEGSFPSLPVSGSSVPGLQALFAQQLDIMQRQIALLGGQNHVTPAQPSALETPSARVAEAGGAITPTLPGVPQANRERASTSASASTPSEAIPQDAWFRRDHTMTSLGEGRDAHLADLARRMEAKTPSSKQFAQKYRAVLADNRASAGFRMSIKEMLYPIVGQRSSGSRFTDIDGNEFIDFTMGFGVNLLGHNPPEIAAALAEQLANGVQIGPQAKQAGEVARLITEMTGLDRVVFCNSGSEAVMTAIRLARGVTKRPKIAVFSGSYHGVFDGVLGRRGAGASPECARPIADGTTAAMVDDLIVLEYGKESALETIERYGEALAGVVVETIQSRHPELQPREFLVALRALADKHGFALIFDEVITGFRLSSGGAQDYFGVRADMATYGKIIGGGLPIGAVAGRKNFLDSIDGGYWQYGDASSPKADLIFFAGTFSKHPLAMAAAQSVLTTIKAQPELYDRINQMTADLAQTLNVWFEALNVPLQIVYAGSLFRFQYSGNYDPLFYHLNLRNIFIWEGRNCFVSAAHSAKDIQLLIDAVKESVLEMRAAGFFNSAKIKFGATFSVTHSQRRFTTLAFDESNAATAAHIVVALSTSKSLSPSTLSRAWAFVTERHISLNMAFLSSFTGIVRDVEPSFSQIDVADEGFSTALKKLEATTFLIAAGPLAKLTLLQSGNESCLALSLHHAVADGWASVVILQELLQAYEQLHQGQSISLPEAPDYTRFVEHEKAVRARAAAMDVGLMARGCFDFRALMPVLDQGALFAADCLTQPLFEADVIPALRQLATSLGVTRFSLLKAVYLTCLSEVFGHSHIPTAVPNANRDFPQGSSLVGQCVELIPFCCDVSSGDVARIAVDVQSHLIKGRESAPVDIGLIRGNKAELPVLAVFNVEPMPPVRELRMWHAQLLLPPPSAAEFPVMVNILEMEDAGSIQISWQKNRISQALIQSLLDKMTSKIEALTNNFVSSHQRAGQ